jgi:hypothetical protein
MRPLISTNIRPKDSDVILLITDALVNSLWRNNTYLLSQPKLLITLSQAIIAITAGAVAKHATDES